VSSVSSRVSRGPSAESNGAGAPAGKSKGQATSRRSFSNAQPPQRRRRRPLDLDPLQPPPPAASSTSASSALHLPERCRCRLRSLCCLPCCRLWLCLPCRRRVAARALSLASTRSTALCASPANRPRTQLLHTLSLAPRRPPAAPRRCPGMRAPAAAVAVAALDRALW
jgi:hypothetical protein